MKIEQIEYIDTEYAADLLDRLLGRVFHVTTRTAFECIREAGAILHNRDERFPLNAASEKSFGRVRGWICLFDLRNQSEEAVQETLNYKYYFLGPSWFQSYHPDFTELNLAYLFLDEAAWHRLVQNEVARRVRPYEQYIPDTEVWFPGDISLHLIEQALLVKIRKKAPKDSEWFYMLHMSQVEEQKRREGKSRG